jgi:acetyl-CoA synthetase
VTATPALGSDFVWEPSADDIQRAHLTAFLRQHGLDSYSDLMRRSADDIAWFSEAILRYLDIRFRSPYAQVVDLSRGPAWPEWCVGGRMNITESCLERNLASGRASQPALIWEGEDGDSQQLTYSELAAQVAQAANALRELGLRKGDVVGLYLPMIPETVVALLATARAGGVALPLFSGFGSTAAASRLSDAGARFLFTADGFPRRGSPVLLKPLADEAVREAGTIEHVIVTRRLGAEAWMARGRDHDWSEVVGRQPAEAAAEDTAAEDLLMLIYTSGTTGRPKAAVHSHCGFPVKAAQDMAFGTDVHPGDRIHWVTDMGWMMGPWLVFGSLILGATMVIYDGAPDYPGPDRLWHLAERHSIQVLGVSPTMIRALLPHGEEPVRRHDLTSLRALASTGEPWNPDPWWWLFHVVGGKRLPIINYSGGTEVSGGIVMGNPTLPLKPCAFSAACPGIAADVFDENGESVRGKVGELVIRRPWIGMTRGFWKDPQRYEQTYWSRWPGVWVHGDWAVVDADGQWYILGRSDDTIKVAGKRLGPAEVESALTGHPAVVEAAAIAIPDEVKGSAVVCLCVLRPGETPSADLAETLRQRVAQELGKPLAPKTVLFVSDLPKTRNAKVMRRMIRSAYLGTDPGDTSSLVNPASLAEIARAAQDLHRA